jgi:hypothetical protein
MVNYNAQIQVRCSRVEKNIAIMLSKNKGLSLSEYLRRLILEDVVRENEKH